MKRAQRAYACEREKHTEQIRKGNGLGKSVELELKEAMLLVVDNVP